MSQDIKLDDNHDLAIENNDIQLVSGPDESAQSILIRLYAYFEEWFLNTSLGTPHYQNVLGNPFRPENQAAIYRRRILQTEGVDSIEIFSFTRINRELRVNATVKLVDGSTVPISITV
jgi:hypothetical protein